MAKKHKKSSTHKRRRVSGIKDLDLKAIGLGVLGGVVANKLTAMLKKNTNTTVQDAAPFAALAAGIIIPMFVKNAMVKQIALGMTVAGGLETLKKVAPKMIAGPYNVPVISGAQRRRMNGGVMNPNAVGQGGYSPKRNSVYQDNLKIISGTMAAGGM